MQTGILQALIRRDGVATYRELVEDIDGAVDPVTFTERKHRIRVALMALRRKLPKEITIKAHWGRGLELVIGGQNLGKDRWPENGLTPTEEMLLGALYSRDVVRYDSLAHFEPETLRQHVMHLRRKMPDLNIRTIRGVGFKLMPPRKEKEQ